MAQARDVDKIAQLPLLRFVPDGMRGRIAQLFAGVSSTIVTTPGEALVRRGELGGDTGYVLLDGAAEVVRDEGAPIRVEAPALIGEMYQFNPHAERTATVRAVEAGRALKFSWQAFYSQAKATLPEPDQGQLMGAIERCILERFDRGALLKLALFHGLPDELRLRVCLLLQWVAHPIAYQDGEVILQQGAMCGGEGYLLARGNVDIRKAGQFVETRSAPDLLGVMPEFNPDLRWTASVTARGAVETLRFAWLELNALFVQRSTRNEQELFAQAIRANAASHFTH